MCRPMSGFAAIIDDTPTIWVSDKTDSHTEIAEEFKLRDNGRHELYAFEFYPDADKPSPDVTTWLLEWDSAATAGMRQKPGDEFACRVRPLIEKRAKQYVFVGGNHRTTACRAWVFGGSVEAYGSSRVEARDSSRVEAYGSSRVEARNSSTTNSYGPKPKKIEENAVWIDRTGDKPKVLLAKKAKA